MGKRFALLSGLIYLAISVCALFSGSALASPATAAKAAQGPATVMFVLDASGSMWARIKGTPKIAIAKEVMKKLVDGIPNDMWVGLSAYGHRKKGDCKDIQTLIKPGPLNRKLFKAKVDGISPKGMTPLSEAVRLAARDLRYTERRATVVLVSDGLETCASDPCALAADLAKAGVDFTVHVIGFAISKDEEQRLRCLADRTGGLFLSAGGAQSLQAALARTVAKVKEAPKPVVQDPGKANLQGPAQVRVGQSFQVKWQGPDSKNDHVAMAAKGSKDSEIITYAYTKTGNPVKLTAPGDKGDYELRYVHGHTGKVIGRAPIKVLPVQASVQTTATAQVAQQLQVKWSGPGYRGDYVGIARPDQKPNEYVHYTYVSQGNPLNLQAPADPGKYQVRYILGQGEKLLAKTDVEIKPASAIVQAPATADMGAKFKVSWQGPGNASDYISIASPGQPGDEYRHYVYVSTGNPVILQAPSQAGQYEVRYILGLGNKLLAKVPIEIKPVSANVQAPATADMGAKIKVSWSGPNGEQDYVSIALPEQGPDDYRHYTYVRSGNPLVLQVPSKPGKYEVRYILGQGNKLLAKVPIEIKPVSAKVQAPAAVNMGAKIKVSWSGPNGEQDYVSIALPDQGPDDYRHYTYVRTDNPLILQAPSKAGKYEVRYILGQGNKLLAKVPIEIKPVSAKVQAPAVVNMGAKFKVSWSGPNGEQDYISIALPDQGPDDYQHYTYVRSGNPLTLQAPDKPGDYEVRYILGQGNALLGKQIIKVK